MEEVQSDPYRIFRLRKVIWFPSHTLIFFFLIYFFKKLSFKCQLHLSTNGSQEKKSCLPLGWALIVSMRSPRAWQEGG